MTDSEKQLHLLQKVFPGLSEERAEELLSHVRERIYPAGTVLCREGATEDTFYLIVEGQVSITKWLDFAKEDRFLRFTEAGGFFGEMAIINEAPRAATVTTTRQTAVLEMNRDDFMKIISSSPSMALAMVRTTIERMRANDNMQLDELNKTYEALQKLDRAKLDFIEVAAHELRTPLTVVQGYSKVLDLSVQDPTQREVVEGMQEGVQRMLEVVNAMLDVTKIDSETLKISPVPVLPKLVAGEALSAFKKAIAQRGLHIVQTHETSESLPFIYADPTLMNKLFYQLISNAIKYTPDGGTIEIHTRETHDSRVGHGLHIMIKDTGVGISGEHMQNIFEKFYQGGDVSLHSSSKTAFMGGGPGLGLAIANGIVRAHKGHIWAESPGFDVKNPPGTSLHVLLPQGGPN
ncbi:MAG: ATP-binding protein [Anaerolineales bacterium]